MNSLKVNVAKGHCDICEGNLYEVGQKRCESCENYLASFAK